MKCNLCPNKCNIDRDLRDGMCHADNNIRICRVAPHYYEEPIISATWGSGAVFFSGCSLDCQFCQNYEISKDKVGVVYSVEGLVEKIKELEGLGVHNINFVTPTHFSHKIREALDIYRPSIPIVYNTSGYELPEVIRQMNDYVDIYLTDYKYADNKLAEQLSGRKNYVDYCEASLEVMVEAKSLIITDGIMKQGVIARHLVLPTYINNSLTVVERFMSKYKDRAVLSVMSQFIPSYKSKIKRTLKPVEYKLVLNKLLTYDTEYCYIQELASADCSYVPIFDK